MGTKDCVTHTVSQEKSSTRLGYIICFPAYSIKKIKKEFILNTKEMTAYRRPTYLDKD